MDERINSIKGIIHYERVDFLFLYEENPFLAVEITAHGYTGDNPLQRFARIYFCAKESVPAIHCSPLARTRYDEIETLGRSASRRNLSSRLTEGFVRLWDVFETPVFVIPIETDEIGLPLMNQIPTILFPVLNHIIEHHIDKQLWSCPIVEEYMDITRKHSMDPNIRESEIRIDTVQQEQLRRITLNPIEFIAVIGRDYFFKGKRDKLLALRALEVSNTEKIIVRSDESLVYHQEDLDRIVDEIFEDYSEDEFSILYSGYQWRPDPISGIVAIERARIGPERILILIWPRIFKDNSARRESLLDEIHIMRRGEDCALSQLLIERMDKRRESGSFVVGFSRNKKQFGLWNETSKPGRICNELCDMIILNDAVIINRRNVT